MARLATVPVVLALWIGCASSTPHETSPKDAGPALFDFHSSFWSNLHHRLHYAAFGGHSPRPAAPTGPHAPAWASAVAFYQQRFAAAGDAGLVFDEEQIAIDARVSQLESAPALAGIEPALASALEDAAESARADWPAQDRANRAWIAALQPALERHGAALRDDLTRVLEAPWPGAPIRVDVSSYAGPFGAYTVEPPRIAISSLDPGYAGEASLEMIFHEASHLLIQPVAKKLEAEAARRGRAMPDNLDHAIIFYTAGELARHRLGEGYVPYAAKIGLWRRGPWVALEAALRRDWQPYLGGKIDLDRAVAALIDDLAGGGTHD